MKQTNKVALLPEVYDFLDVLAQTLLEKDYVSYIEHGENMVLILTLHTHWLTFMLLEDSLHQSREEK